MKLEFTLLFIFLLAVCKGQDYQSNKQSYLKGYETKFTPVIGDKSISIKNDTLFAELPTGDTFNGEIRFFGNQTSSGKTGKRYDIGNNDLIVVYEDEIFLNLEKHKGIVITYFLTNYKEPSPEQRKLNKLEEEKAEYKINLELYGKFTADCIEEKKVKIGMNYMGIEAILGKPLSINATQTAKSFDQQYVYKNMYIYTQMNKVTSIQQTFESK